MPTASKSAWSGGGGGAALHARQQRQRKCQGESQLLTRRSATGQQFPASGSPAGGEAGAAASPFSPHRLLDLRDGAVRLGGVDAPFRRAPGRGVLPVGRRLVRTAEAGPPAET